MQNVHTIKQCHPRYIAMLPAEKVVATPLELQLPNNEIQRKAFPIRMLGRNLGLDTGLNELLRGLPQSLLLHFGQRLKPRRHNFCLPHCFQFFIQKYLHNGGNKSLAVDWPTCQSYTTAERLQKEISSNQNLFAVTFNYT
jgi:hypothetical protein